MHGSQPLLLSSSDDMTIRLWDWEKQWMNTMTFEGHSHYVMMVAFNPRHAAPPSITLTLPLTTDPHLNQARCSPSSSSPPPSP